jgi:hypothetical protein
VTTAGAIAPAFHFRRPNVRFTPAALSLLLALPAASQNLVTNGTFATNIAGWGTFDPNIVATWSPLDADGSTQSGSLLLTNQAPNGLNSGGYQCLGSVTPGKRLDIGGKIRIPSGGAQGQTFLIVFFLSNPNCSGSVVGPTNIVGATAFDAWTPVQIADVVVPAGAASAQFQLSVIKNFPNALSYQSYFDDLHATVAQLTTLTVPASASIHGQNGTFFQTDLQLMNLSKTAATTVTARHRCFAGQTCSGSTPSIALAPRETKTFSNVLVSLFGDSETAGAIELTYDAAVGAIAATTRTYTPALPAPTYGTGIPGLASTEARTATMFVGLANNGGNLSGGFRTNAGAYNPNASAVTVTYTLLKADGTVLGTTTRTLGPNEAQQVNDVFGAAGAGATVTTAASLQVTATLTVFPYVTIIDNQSSDQVYAQAFLDPNP